jgi:hypothetical protein
MKTVGLLIITMIFGLNAQAQCSKQLEKNENYSSGPIIQSKDIVFHSPSLSNNKDISFVVKDSSRLFVHFDITYGTWRVGSNVEFKFQSGATVTTEIKLWESEIKGSYTAKRYDCQIENRDDVERFMLEDIEKITVHCVGRTFEISTKKRKRIRSYLECTVNTVGLEKINYRSAVKSEADPYVDNTIVVSFGNDNQSSKDNYDHIDCDYEKNEVDDFTGDKTTITKFKNLGENLSIQMQHINGKTFLNLQYIGVLGCANVESFVIFKFSDATTLKFMNLSKEDCGDNPILKIDLTNKMSIMKIRNIEKIRVTYSDGHADVIAIDQKLVKGILNKCL